VGDALWDADDVLKSGDQLFMDLIKLKQASLAAKPAKMPEVPKSVLIDVAVAIGIDAKDAKDSRILDALAKVLNTTPHDKWADGLAKLAATLKLKSTNGKTMVIAIDKLPYFKKQLIEFDSIAAAAAGVVASRVRRQGAPGQRGRDEHSTREDAHFLCMPSQPIAAGIELALR
jgi:hypothetical protein